VKRTYELSQFKISNVFEFLDSLLGSLRTLLIDVRKFLPNQCAISNWNSFCIDASPHILVSPIVIV